jgi:hypothetical protein
MCHVCQQHCQGSGHTRLTGGAVLGCTQGLSCAAPAADLPVVAHRTFIVIGGVDAANNFTASVETLDVIAAKPAW